MLPLVSLVLLFPQVPPQDGVTLYAPLGENDTHLLELGKKNVHTWAGTAAPGLAVYLRKNGNLLRTYKVGGLPGSGLGGSGGGIQEVAWDGAVVWEAGDICHPQQLCTSQRPLAPPHRQFSQHGTKRGVNRSRSRAMLLHYAVLRGMLTHPRPCLCGVWARALSSS